MPRLTPVRKRALDEMMKEALFEATVTVLAEHGAEGLTMDRVAVAAGVAKGSLYTYFRSKKDLVEFVHCRLIDPILADLAEIIASDRPALEKLAVHLRRLLEHVTKHARVFNLLLQDDTAHGLLKTSERHSRELGSQLLSDVFRQGIAEGVFRSANPLTLAQVFFGICVGVFNSQPDLERSDARESTYAMILGVFLNGIATERVPIA